MFTGFILGRRRGLLLRVRFITAAFDKASSDDQKRPADRHIQRKAKGQQCQAYRRACVGFWRPLGRAGLPARPNGFPGLAEKAQVEHPVVGIGFDVPLYGAVQRGE